MNLSLIKGLMWILSFHLDIPKTVTHIYLINSLGLQHVKHKGTVPISRQQMMIKLDKVAIRGSR